MTAIDFRDHVCGNCAWLGGNRVDLTDDGGKVVNQGGRCRRNSFGSVIVETPPESPTPYAVHISLGMVVVDSPACPAFIPREKSGGET